MMQRARIIVLAIAFAAAGGAALIAKRMMSAPQPVQVVEAAIDTVEVLIAAKQIRLGDSVRSSDVTWQVWPKAAATVGYITKAQNPRALSRLSGAIARAPFLKGEPIKEQKLIKASDGGVLAAILPSGMRAISTPIREETSAGGFILPNDRVDVIVSRRLRSARGEEHISETLLRNVRVLAIGQNIETKDGKKVANGKTATLELTIRQAETLALAQSMGEISLALRSLADANPAGGSGPRTDEDALGDGRGGSVRMLKYGVSSRAYGVN
ncbi:MAG: Flp pilus assembly protein CpaB [Hyphomicrobiales bacterium]|nr:Flp pilus assembly protein CpaB [Hyphomicrobiales bacterium]